MQYPGTIDNWYDQSAITSPEISDDPLRPVLLTAFAGPKGPERITKVHGEDFYKLFGYSLDSEKYGQALIQASVLINKGAELICKRVVASNATLANAIICATLTPKTVQKKDAQGKPLYIDNVTDKETTSATDANGSANDPANITAAEIKYSVLHCNNCKTKAEVVAAALKLRDKEAMVFPLFVIVDNGRGTSTKRFSITPDYTVSKGLSYMLYNLNYLGTKNMDYEYTRFALTPGTVFGNQSMSLSMVSKNLMQSEAVELDACIEDFYTEIANITGIGKTVVEDNSAIDVTPAPANETTGETVTEGESEGTETGDGETTTTPEARTTDPIVPENTTTYTIDNKIIKGYDVLFGKTLKGDAAQSIIIDSTGANLSASVGFVLAGGSDGDFATTTGSGSVTTLKITDGTSPYETALIEFFKGEYDSDIYNLDRFQIDACLDANYPPLVKKAIGELADYRKDFVFFEDYTTECTSYESAIQMTATKHRSRFTALYPQTFNVIDPFSKKFINVTMPYAIAQVIVDHLRDRVAMPYCGIIYDWVFPDVIIDTLNFTPKITPDVNQKTELGDLGVNYASILNDVLTMETTYTSQELSSQLSFINNVTAIQEVVKDVRVNAPSFRYSFSVTADLERYKTKVDDILMRYQNNFALLEFVYVQDDIMAANKIFEADIRFRHKNFIQAELLNLYTLASESVTTVGENI